MLGVLNDILMVFDNNLCTFMLFLDLSAAFDTIDITKLVEILSEEIGVSGVALDWFKSFLTGRKQRVNIKDKLSDILEVLYGTPQGSVLGPILFNIYVRSQPKVFQMCKFKTSSFADDSNGRKTFALQFQYNVLKKGIASCMQEIMNWINLQFLKINPEKTEILLIRPKS